MMKKMLGGGFAALLLATTMLPPAALALDEQQKEEMGAFIREYLLSNPEIIEEMQVALAGKQEAEQSEQAKKAIAENADAIFNAEGDAVLGNPQGDVTIVEFFDYNCGFCKRALSDMEQILESDPDVRFVLKEFPILGPDSLAAHRVSMSFRKLMPEKYGDFHRELLDSEARANEERAIEVATGLGADEEALRAGMEMPEVDASIRQAYELADALGINGTPSYVVGDEAIFGAMGAEVLETKVENIRTCQSAAC